MQNVPIPRRMLNLPIDEQWHLPVPFFVSWIDGKPEFRVAESEAWIKCVKQELCWVCGQKLGVHRAFVIGPMCSINLVSADPPMHRECAEYSVKVCPFLTQPKMVRREKDRPPEEMLREMPGMYISRNPGVSCLWLTRKHEYRIEAVPNGYLFRLFSEPDLVEWYAHGRLATRTEVMESVDSGYPILLKSAAEEGVGAVKHLQAAKKAMEARLLPAA
jgi:hypothetical protein